MSFSVLVSPVSQFGGASPDSYSECRGSSSGMWPNKEQEWGQHRKPGSTRGFGPSWALPVWPACAPSISAGEEGALQSCAEGPAGGRQQLDVRPRHLVWFCAVQRWNPGPLTCQASTLPWSLAWPQHLLRTVSHVLWCSECRLGNQFLFTSPRCRSQSEMSSIVVQNPMSLPEGACNSVPFSWRIRDYLDELWVQARYITDTEGEPAHGGQPCEAASPHREAART